MLDVDVFAERGIEPQIYRMAEHKTWGNAIFWWRDPDKDGRGRLHGHLRPRRPQPGDRVICPMQSGRNAIFEVQSDGNSYPMDPPDQFFVNVAFAGYEDTDETGGTPHA